jgi:alanine dehydrogenase
MTDHLLWLTEHDVAALIDLADVIAQIELFLLDEHRGNAKSIPKALGTWDERSSAHALGAVSPARGLACFKTWVNTPRGASAVLSLFDAEQGRVLAMFQAGTLGFMRTAAINGVAAKYLSSPDATSMAVIGSGRQALPQVAAVAAVRPLENVHVFSPTREHRVAFAERVTEELDLPAVAVDSLSEAVCDQPIVTVITRARDPFLGAELLTSGVHVNAAGAVLPANAELMGDVLARSSLTVVDSVENARKTSRELIGHDDWESVVPLHAVIGGVVGRPESPDLTVFKGMGMGLSDLAAASLVYERAIAQGVGQEIPKTGSVTPRWRAERV